MESEEKVPWDPIPEVRVSENIFPSEDPQNNSQIIPFPFDEWEIPEEPSEKESTYPFTFITDILQAPPIEWLIEDILFDRTFSILGGYTGYGKSLLALAIAQSIAEGSPLFGRYNVNRQGKVLIVDEENSHSDLKDRILRMGINEKLPIYFLSFQGVQLDDKTSFNRLFETIIKLQPVLVIFDSLVRFHGKNENDASEMSRVMARFREITNREIGVLVLHHHNKGMGPLEIRTRGSSDIVGICDVEYALWRNGDDLMLSTVKTRRIHIETIKLSIESSQDDLKIQCLGTAEDEQKMMMMVIDDKLKEKPLVLPQLQEFLINNGYDISLKKLRIFVNENMIPKFVNMETGKHGKKLYYSLADGQA